MALEMNVGSKDRSVRISIGVILILLYLFEVFGPWSLVVGALILISGLVRFCPLYKMLSKSTVGS